MADQKLRQTNEYETLMLLMGDCRERLVAYKISEEDDMGLLKRKVSSFQPWLLPIEVGSHG